MLNSSPSAPNERFLKAIRREPVDCTPIWLMRQAGRYLPEYRALRAQAGSFMTLCQTPELACQVTLQPLERFDLDAAIIFSDILTIPDAMGLNLEVIEGVGPVFARTIRQEKDIADLKVPELARLDYVYEAIRLVSKELDNKLPLIGFCGSPWTLAAYMIEGKSVPGFPTALHMLKTEPARLLKLLAILAESVTLHLKAQIEAGVQAVMIFDTWGFLLGDAYELFSLQYIRSIIDQLKQPLYDKKVPVILFAKSCHQWLESLAASGCDVVSIDEGITLKEARARVGHQVALQGNLAPQALLASADDVRHQAMEVLAAYGYGSGHIFNLAHGVTPDIFPEHVKLLIEVVHEMSQPYHVR